MGRGGSGGRSGGGSFGGSRSSGGRIGGNFGGSRRSGGSPFGNGNSGRGIFGKSSGGSMFGGGIPGGGIPGRVNTGQSGRRAFNPGGPGGCGCSTLIIVLIVIAVIIFIIVFGLSSFFGGSNDGTNGSMDVTKSTVEREPLPKGSVNETSYFTDEIGWINNQTILRQGLKYFYQETGVQPYLYITENIDGSHSPSTEDIDKFANELYEELFTDEAHLLFVFFEYDNNYMDWYVCGTQAKTVIDDEAADILLDYIDRYYYDDSLTDEEFFSNAFSDAADRIMTVTRSPWIPALILIGFAALCTVLFIWWRHAKKQKNLEAEQMEDILKTPLEKFGDGNDAENLAKKYDSSDSEELGKDNEKKSDR